MPTPATASPARPCTRWRTALLTVGASAIVALYVGTIAAAAAHLGAVIVALVVALASVAGREDEEPEYTELELADQAAGVFGYDRGGYLVPERGR